MGRSHKTSGMAGDLIIPAAISGWKIGIGIGVAVDRSDGESDCNPDTDYDSECSGV
ncbi:MAG: hypothetical protein P8Z37_14740 [Acidobacteriota bacterium]